MLAGDDDRGHSRVDRDRSVCDDGVLVEVIDAVGQLRCDADATDARPEPEAQSGDLHGVTTACADEALGTGDGRVERESGVDEVLGARA